MTARFAKKRGGMESFTAEEGAKIETEQGLLLIAKFKFAKYLFGAKQQINLLPNNPVIWY